MKKLFIGLVFILLLLPLPVMARQNVDYWYVKSFDSDIQVNKDSTALVTEKIVAGCGNAEGKHGIFRVLPTQVQKTPNETIITPIELISITDFNGNSLKYSTINDASNHTITWKIGDPNKTVQGENNYKIIYRVKNVIRFDNPNFDEFYWNLVGNFWDIEIDQFQAKITFPPEITQGTTQIDYYTGSFGSKSKSLANYKWTADNILTINSTSTLKVGDGITLSATMPKNIFTPYPLYPWEKSHSYLFWGVNIFGLLLPFIFLFISLKIWRKYGMDPKLNRSIAPEFDIPDKLAPIELGMVYTNGKLKNHFVSAAIINLAVKGILKIEKVEGKGILHPTDYKLIFLKKDAKDLSESEQLLIKHLFAEEKNEVLISALKDVFYKDISAISNEISNNLLVADLIEKKGYIVRIIYLVLMAMMVTGSIGMLALSPFMFAGLLLSAIIAFVFAIIMPKRTVKGLDLFYRIKGFKMYMETAEKYRQQFNEKENIFERFLPYAILFGMTTQWIKKIKTIYGQEYFNSYVPVWFVGQNLRDFDPASLDTAISNLSSNMASTLASNPSASGAGGGGFSGGGGGGGGGGGW